MTLDSKDMGLRGRIGGFSKAAKHAADELTAPARAAFLKRFEPQDSGLSDAERQRRAQCALKAYMVRLARRSALARSKRKASRESEEP